MVRKILLMWYFPHLNDFKHAITLARKFFNMHPAEHKIMHMKVKSNCNNIIKQLTQSRKKLVWMVNFKYYWQTSESSTQSLLQSSLKSFPSTQMKKTVIYCQCWWKKENFWRSSSMMQDISYLYYNIMSDSEEKPMVFLAQLKNDI